MNRKNNHLILILLEKSTVLYILCPFLIVICLFNIFYLALFRQQEYETPFGILFFLVTIVVLAVLWLVDRSLVNFVRPVILSAVELVLIGSLWLWFSYSNREFIIDASACSERTFIIAYTIDEALAEIPDTVFPFSKKITISDRNYVIVSDAYRVSETNSFSPSLKLPANWKNRTLVTGMEGTTADSRFTSFTVYLRNDYDLLSLPEREKTVEIDRERAVKEFLTRIKK
jgi:hypothetical protein